MMGRCYFLSFLLVSLLLALSFSTGFGRQLLESAIGGGGGDEFDATTRKDASKTIELSDYGATGPNFNSRSALPFFTTPPPSPCQPPAPALTN